MQNDSTPTDQPIDQSTITTYQSGIIQAAAVRALRRSTEESLAPHGITTMQWFIIGTILDAGVDGIRLTDLAKRIDTTMSYLTTTVKLLESKGIVTRTRDSGDLRTHHISVAERYVPTCHAIEEDLRSKMRATIYAQISPQELRTYLNVLLKLSALGTERK